MQLVRGGFVDGEIMKMPLIMAALPWLALDGEKDGDTK